MRLVGLDELQGTEVVAKTIIDVNGRVLLAKGMVLKLSYLNKLDNIGITSVYIEDGISEGIEINDVLCDETRQQARSIIQHEMLKYSRGKDADVYEVQKIVDLIVQEILSNKFDLMNLKDLRIKDEYTFSHSVNVCVLSVMLSTKMGLDKNKIQSIGTGCLLHDLGKILVPTEILNNPGKLSNEEFDEIKSHPLYGYRAVKDEVNVSPTTKVVILMHHERIDGSGYPNGLRGEKIHDAAKICSICDVFDAMTSDRVYRKALSTSDAVEYLFSTAGIYFEKRFVDEFLKYIPIYPTGAIVLLSNGAIAIVVKNNRANLTRPVVRLLYNPKSKIKYSANYDVDMTEDLTLKIVREVKFDVNEYKSIGG